MSNFDIGKEPGLCFVALTAIPLATLKLLGVIGWSWLWVLAPIWALVLLVGSMFALFWLAWAL